MERMGEKPDMIKANSRHSLFDTSITESENKNWESNHEKNKKTSA
jgi:hypothetical protein